MNGRLNNILNLTMVAVIGAVFTMIFATPSSARQAKSVSIAASSNEPTLVRDQKTAIQRALKAEGYYNSAIDGDFGPGTRRAIKAFQRDAGLEQTGFLTDQQINFLIEVGRKDEVKKLEAYRKKSIEQEKPTDPNEPNQNRVEVTKTKEQIYNNALNRTFSGPFGGQWAGTLECKIEPRFAKEIAIRIDGGEVRLDNLSNYSNGDNFTHVGEIELEDGFIMRAGDISLNGGSLTLANQTLSWFLGGKWQSDAITLTGKLGESDCWGTFVKGISEEVEEVRIAADIYKKNMPYKEKNKSLLSELFGDTQANETNIENSSPPKTQPSEKGFFGAVSNIFGTTSGASVGSIPGVIQTIGGALIDDEIFNGRSSVETYIAITRLLHLATKRAAAGIVDAMLALGLKDEKDIPQYLLDIQTASIPNSFTGQIAEQDTKVIEYASSAAEEIKEKLKSGEFTLSKETKAQLGEAYRELSLAKIYQGKTFIGVGVLALKISDPNVVAELKGFVENSNTATREISDIFGNIKDLLTNFSDIVHVAEIIEETEDVTGVELAKTELIEESANKEISNDVLSSLEAAAK